MKTSKRFRTAICIIMMTIFAVSLFSAIPAQAQGTLVKTGELSVLGSSTIYPVSALAKNAFETYVATKTSLPPVTVLLNDLGSGAGLNALKALPPTTDIAASSTSGFDQGLYTSGLANPQEFRIGYDSIAFIVPATNTWLSQATSKQIVDLFRTTDNGNNVPLYKTWGDWAAAQVPPVQLDSTVASQDIVRIGREFSSGTFDGFNTYFLSKNGCDMKYAPATGTTAGNWLPSTYRQLSSNSEVRVEVAKTANAYAIGFIGLGFVQEDLITHPHGIKALNLYNPEERQYIVPSLANVKAGIYVNDQGASILRPLCFFMDGIPSANSPEAVKSLWISYIKAHPEWIEEEGYLPLNRIDFTGRASGNAGVGTENVPDDLVDFEDLAYFAQAWINFYSSARTLNPYADLHGPNGLPDGVIDFEDLSIFALSWIEYYK